MRPICRTYTDFCTVPVFHTSSAICMHRYWNRWTRHTSCPVGERWTVIIWRTVSHVQCGRTICFTTAYMGTGLLLVNGV